MSKPNSCEKHINPTHYLFPIQLDPVQGCIMPIKLRKNQYPKLWNKQKRTSSYKYLVKQRLIIVYRAKGDQTQEKKKRKKKREHLPMTWEETLFKTYEKERKMKKDPSKPCPGGSLNSTLVRIHVKKMPKRGDFCHRLVGSRDLQKGGISKRVGVWLKILMLCRWKGCSDTNTYIPIFNTRFPWINGHLNFPGLF